MSTVATPVTAEVAPAAPAKRGRVKLDRVDYPGLVNAEGASVLLEAWPDDFVRTKHNPLARGNFKDECIWIDRKADDLEKKVVALRKESEDIKRLGDLPNPAKARKLLKMQAAMAALAADLATEGVDVSGLLAPAAEVDAG